MKRTHKRDRFHIAYKFIFILVVNIACPCQAWLFLTVSSHHIIMIVINKLIVLTILQSVNVEFCLFIETPTSDTTDSQSTPGTEEVLQQLVTDTNLTIAEVAERLRALVSNLTEAGVTANRNLSEVNCFVDH